MLQTAPENCISDQITNQVGGKPNAGSAPPEQGNGPSLRNRYTPHGTETLSVRISEPSQQQKSATPGMHIPGEQHCYYLSLA